MLPFSGHLTIPKGDHRAGSGLAPSVKLGLGHADSHGRAVVIAAKVLHATHRPPYQVGCLVMSVRPSLAEGRDRRHYETGVDAAEVLIAQAQAIHVAGRERLQNEVGLGCEALESLLALVAFEVDGHAALVQAVGVPEKAAFRMLFVIDKWPTLSGRATANRLDLDDIGAQVGQHLATPVETTLRQVESSIRAKGRICAVCVNCVSQCHRPQRNDD